MSSNRLAEDNPVLLPPPDPRRPPRPIPPHPTTAYEWALSVLAMDGSPADLPFDLAESAAAEHAKLLAQGITPERATVLLKRIESGAPAGLRVIDGGGKSTKRRARLSLVPPITGRPASAPALPTVA